MRSGIPSDECSFRRYSKPFFSRRLALYRDAHHDILNVQRAVRLFAGCAGRIQGPRLRSGGCEGNTPATLKPRRNIQRSSRWTESAVVTEPLPLAAANLMAAVPRV